MFKRSPFTLQQHLGLLLGFCAFMLGLWMLPVLLAGFPYRFPDLLENVWIFDSSGVLPAVGGRLVTVVLWWLHPFIGPHDIAKWTFVSAVFLALALIPWWWSVRKLFDVHIAWLSTVVLSLMPIYWIEALRLTGYTFALFFLFLGFALFLEFRSRNRMLAVVLFGVCFGAVLGGRDAFITFIPWLVGAYIWMHYKKPGFLRRKGAGVGWKRASLEAVLGLATAYIVFSLPLLFSVAHSEGSITDRLAIFLPPIHRTDPGVGHLYPDDYTYEFEKEAYDEIIRERMATEDSFLVKQQSAKVLRHFGFSSGNPFVYIKDSTWLFLNVFPSLLLQDTVGGAFLWLFMLPGLAYLFFKRRIFFVLLIGLWLSTEFVLRYVLHFGRHHLEDTGWIVALLVGIGIALTAEAVHKQWKHLSIPLIAIAIVAVTGMQLVQANRQQFARFYRRSDVAQAYAAEYALENIPVPEDAVVAHPRRYHLFFFTDLENVNINKETVDWLYEEGKLREPFQHYGVTHIIGYDEERVEKIVKVLPRVEVLTISEKSTGVALTPFIKYLLHIVR